MSYKKSIDLDDEFIRSQLELKFSNETSPLVIRSLIAFNARLLKYIDLEKLVGSEAEYLLKFFTVANLPNDQDSEEIKAFVAKQNEDLFECRQGIIELIFSDLYSSSDNKELFFNCFLVIVGKLFEIRSADLLSGLKRTPFYADMVQESSSTDASPSTTPPKSYPTKSSITISKISKLPPAFTNGNGLPNGNGSVAKDAESMVTDDSDGLVDVFESLISLVVKYMLTSGKKLNKGVVRAPKCFDDLSGQLKAGVRRPVQFLDFIIFDICVRVSNQSLFAQNSSYYLSLAASFLTSSLLASDSIKLKKTKSKDLNSIDHEQTNGSSVHGGISAIYGQIVRKQAIKSALSLAGLYQMLLKAITIQMSNFVNTNIRAEIEQVLNELYVSLCLKSPQDLIYPHIIQKLTQAHCFFFHQAPASQIQTSLAPVAKGTVNHQFFNFAFKFLVDQSNQEVNNNNDQKSLVQSKTIQLFSNYIKDLLASEKKHDSSLVSGLVLALTCCLTSTSQDVRVEALDLLEKIGAEGSESEGESFMWSAFIRKLVKHRQEIQVDRVDYLSSKCLSKILNNNESDQAQKILDSVNQFLTTPADPVNTKVQRQLFFFSFASDSSAAQLVNQFKHALLDLFKLVKEDVKLKIFDSCFSLFMSNIAQLTSTTKDKVQLVKINELIITNYFLTKKSASFFNSHEKQFKALVSFLNTSFGQMDAEDGAEVQALKLKLVECFVEALSSQSVSIKFFQQLSFDNQLDLLKCCLEMWLSKSFNWATSIADENKDSNSARKCLLTFDLTAKHYFHLFNERANLKLKSTGEKPATAKEMKKQMIQARLNTTALTTTGPAEGVVNWKYLKAIVELVQLNLINLESKVEMDTDGQCAESSSDKPAEQFIELIPYLFLALQTIETVSPVFSSEDDSIDLNINEYLEIVCLNSLMLIYKLNSSVAESKLVQGDL